MEKVKWTADAMPENVHLAQLMYALRLTDADNSLLDSVMMYSLYDEAAEAVPMLDAMVVEVNRMSVTMEKLQRVMLAAAGDGPKPTDFTIGDPVRLKGTMQIPVLFAMDDGQAITIWFHNPDTTPNKLMPLDELISWKWLLNKKDVTIVVAPENGKELSPREIARRVMRLVARNSAAFTKANERASERAAAEAALDAEISQLTGELASLQDRLEVARQSKADKDAEDARAAAAEAALSPGQKVNRALAALGWSYPAGPKLQGLVTMSRTFEGLAADGDLSDGSRVTYASWGADSASLTLQLGWDNVMSMRMTPGTAPDEFAAEFNRRAEEWAAQRQAENAAPAPTPDPEPTPEETGEPTGLEDMDTGKPDNSLAAQRIVAIKKLLEQRGFTGEINDRKDGVEMRGPLSSLLVYMELDKNEPNDFMVGVDDFEEEPDYDSYATRNTNEEIADYLEQFDFEQAHIERDDDGKRVMRSVGTALDGKPMAFGLACIKVLEPGATAAGVSVHYGDFQDSTSASLFDDVTGSASVVGITAQLHKGGNILARASVTATGEITLLTGSHGSEVLSKPKTADDVTAALRSIPAKAEPALVLYRGLELRRAKWRIGGQEAEGWEVQKPENKLRVANGEREISGNPLVPTLAIAKETADRLLKDEQDNAAYAEELAKREAEEKAKQEAQRAQLIDVDGFGEDMKPLGRERMYVTLDAKIRYRGQVMSRKAMIRMLVNEGRRVETNSSGARILAEQGEGGAFHDEKTLTKTGMDYASYLGKKLDAESAQAELDASHGPYWYGMRMRPLSIGTVPKDFKSTMPAPAEGAPFADAARHGIVTYAERLSPEDVKAFELIPLIHEDAGRAGAIASFVASVEADYRARYVEYAEENGVMKTYGILVGLLDDFYRKTMGNRVEFGISEEQLATEVLEAMRAAAPAPEPAPEPEPTPEPTPEPDQQPETSQEDNVTESTSAIAQEDRDYLQTLIEGSVPMMDESHSVRLEELYHKYLEDAEAQVLIEKAATAYGDAIIAASVSALSKV